MTLRIFQTDNKDLRLLQESWVSEINPLLRSPSLKSLILSNISLATGSNSIPHLLGRKLIGWRVIRLRGPATIYDTQDSNPMPDKTLFLVSSADVSADLEVF